MYSLYRILAFVAFVILISGSTAVDPRRPYNEPYNYKGFKAKEALPSHNSSDINVKITKHNSSDVTLKISDFIPKPVKYWKMVIEFFSDPAIDDTPAVANKSFNATELLSNQNWTETNSNNSVLKHSHNQYWKITNKNATHWNSTHWNVTHSNNLIRYTPRYWSPRTSNQGNSLHYELLHNKMLQSLERGIFPESFSHQYDQHEKYALIFTSYDEYKNSEAYRSADSSFEMRNFAIHNNGDELLVIHVETVDTVWGDFKFELFPDWTALIANIPTFLLWKGTLRAYRGWEDCNSGEHKRGVTKLEWNAGNKDDTLWINLSLVDGYNIPMEMVWGNREPSQSSQFMDPLWNRACPALKCAVDSKTLHKKCPEKNSRWTHGGFQCISDCEVAKFEDHPDQEKICCVNYYDDADPTICVPSNLYFREECPNTIIYAHDDLAGTHVCNPGTIVGVEIGGGD